LPDRLTARLRAALALVAVLAIAGCSTLQVDTAVRLRALDLLNDDIGDLVLALDVPVQLLPRPENSFLTLRATGADGSAISARAQLIRADAQDLAATLPEPKQDRGYYLFAFPDESKAKLRETQAAIRAARDNGGASGPEVTLNIDFCALGAVDPGKTTFSARVALPGEDRLEPLINNETVANLIARTGAAELSSCGSFSE